MTVQRSQLIREVETELQQTRARAMLRTLRHAGKTATEVQAERRRFLMKVWHVAILAVGILVGVGLLIGAWVL